MQMLLAGIEEDCQGNNIYLGWKPVQDLRARLEGLTSASPPLLRARIEYRLGRELLRMGETGKAIETLSASSRDFGLALSKAKQLPQDLRLEYAEVLLQLGTAYLRLAEDHNCCLKSNRDSCILPIRGGGIHHDKEGSTLAMKSFEAVLKGVRLNSQVGRRARWLLNIAAMTLDNYPDGVPEKFRIDPKVFESDEPFARFVDVAPKLGLTDVGLAGGMVTEDFNGDGFLDMLTSDSDASGRMHLYLSDGAGHFMDQSEQDGLEGLFGGLNLVSGDYDNDGDVDIFVLRGAWMRGQGKHPNSLLRNEGQGRFVDVTFAAGLGKNFWPTQTAAFADYDNDGHLDLYVGNESEPGRPAPCELFRNNGDGTFTDVALAAGVSNHAYTKGVAWGDIDSDGDMDLYVSNMAGPNRLYENDGRGRFVDVAAERGVTGPFSGFACWFFDHDNDGHLDLFAASYGGPQRPPTLADVAGSYMGLKHKGELMQLYRGDGKGHFKALDQKDGIGVYTLPMGANYGDADNDGFDDIYLGTGYPFYEGLMPNVMLRNQAGQGFANVTSASGLGHLQKGHGVAFADMDGDGDQEIVVRMGGAYPGDGYRCVLFRNPGNGNHWLKVGLVGKRSNSFGVGAQIRVDLIEGERKRSVYRTVSTGGSFGCKPMRQEIGLGQSERIENLEIYWPSSGIRTSYAGVSLDTSIEIEEGATSFRRLQVARMNLGMDPISAPASSH